MMTQKELLEELRDLLGLIEEAETAAYEKPAGVAKNADSPVIKSGEDYSDPTGDAVANPKRLTLAARLERSKRAIDEATRHLRGARELLESGLDAWAGITDEDSDEC